MKNFYSLDKCHFCGNKLVGEYIAFAKLTDYVCNKKKCKKKYSYNVAYDNASQTYYEVSFEYQKYIFRYFLNKEGNIPSMMVAGGKLNDYLKFKEVSQLSNAQEIEQMIERIEKLEVFI